MANSDKNIFDDTKQDNLFNEEESSFDIMRWIRLIIRYWYLFVISIGVAGGLAFFSNKKWTPTYKVAARIIVEEKGRSNSSSAAAMMEGFDVQRGFRNIENQLILFKSLELTNKAVDRMGLQVDYYSYGRFKTNNLYKAAPIEIKYDSLPFNVYALEFKFKNINDTLFEISTVEADEKFLNIFSKGKPDASDGMVIKGKYGVPIADARLNITVNKTLFLKKDSEIYFRFRTRGSWASDFNSRLAVSYYTERSSVVEVSLTGKVAERDKDFINALCEEILADNLNRKNDAAIKTIEFIDAQLTSIADSLNIAEAKLRTFRAQNKMSDISAYSNNIIAQINLHDQKRVELNLKKSYLDYLSDYLRSNIEDGKIVAPSSMGVMDPMLMRQVQEYTDLQIKRDEMGEKSPYYKKYQTQIDNKKEALFEILNNMYGDYKIEMASFNEQYNKLLGELASLPDKESQMSNYQRVYKTHDGYYTYLMQKRVEAQIQKASNSPDIIIMGNASSSGPINGGEKNKKMTQNLIIGFLLPLVFIVLKELLNTTIRDKNDIKKYTSYDIIGSIQKGKYESDNNLLVVKKNPKSLFAEGFRLIRTRLEFITKYKENKSATILVTSTESGDGKTFFSINLSGIYAMEKKKTVLIDLDLRKPSISKSMSLISNKGISNYLIGQVDLDEIIIQDEERGFDVILAGTIPPNPGELIKSEKLKEVLEILKKKYEYIVIDASPIGLVGDAYALVHHVDANLFIVRQEKTNKTFFRNVVEQLKEDHVPNVYIVLNGVDVNKNEYSTYHGYAKRLYPAKKGSNHYYEYYDN